MTEYEYEVALSFADEIAPTSKSIGAEALGIDLIPSFRTKLSMIFAKERGKVYVEKQTHGSADDRGAEASGGRTEGRRRGARSGGIETHERRQFKQIEAMYQSYDETERKDVVFERVMIALHSLLRA